MLPRRGNEEILLDNIIFSDEQTFHISGKVNSHNCRIQGREIYMHLWNKSPKVKDFIYLKYTPRSCHGDNKKWQIIQIFSKMFSLHSQIKITKMDSFTTSKMALQNSGNSLISDFQVDGLVMHDQFSPILPLWIFTYKLVLKIKCMFHLYLPISLL